MRKILFCTALLFVTLSSQASLVLQVDTNDTGSFLDGTAASAKMIAARHEFNEHNMRGALTLYREILETEPKNAAAMYWTAKCHYELKKYKLAKEYLDKSVTTDESVRKDVNLFYGQIHHRLAQLDMAIEYFEAFLKEDNGRKYDQELAREYINQCAFAKEMMAQPANVEIENMGRAINSRFDDYTPSITANGELLIFTSRRSDTKGGEIDEGSDYKFYEDIYYSRWNEEKKEWSKSIGAEGLVNTNTYDAVLSISPSGDQMFVYKNNKNSAGDIFVSKYNYHEEEWKECEKMERPINTSYFESSVSITSDGNTLYFISERPEGNGQGDIYKSEKKSGGGWSSPKNLGKLINTPYDEKFVFVHPNGKTLFFASDGHQTMGSYDIFKTEFVNGQWSIPINLGYPINTVNQESTFSLTKDNKTLLIAAHYDDTFGERDIYKIDVSNYPLLSSGYESSGYGTVITNVSDANGNLQKGLDVKFLYASTNRIITEGVTDKLGRVRINLPGNTKYKMQIVRKKEVLKEEVFNLKLDPHGETVKKFDVKLD